MRLRLFHHADGARIAYREAGTGPPLVLLHSLGLTHREFEPVVEHLADRFRLVLPDLPLHGDSEDRPRHPYTPDWLAEIVAAFCIETAGPRPLVGGHGLGAELLLRAAKTSRLHPSKLVLMPTRLHHPSELELRGWRTAAKIGSLPGVDRLASHAVRAVVRPELAMKLTVRGNPAARDLLRHATADISGNANLARAWGKLARNLPRGAQHDLLDAFGRLDTPVLLLWADEDEYHPLAAAEEALDLLPDAQLRVLSSTGYLIAYDDPVGVARELAAFCG